MCVPPAREAQRVEEDVGSSGSQSGWVECRSWELRPETVESQQAFPTAELSLYPNIDFLDICFELPQLELISI